MKDDFYTVEVSEPTSIDIYFDHIKKIVSPDSLSKNITFGIDGGNGAIGSIIENFKQIYNLNYLPIFLDIDGNFPNHPPDPSNKNNLKDLINLVQKNKLDFG